MSGWIKIHRKFLDWEWFNKSEAVHLFLYMLLKANHKDNKWQGNDVKRGQFISSLGNISSATGITIQQIRTILKKLEKTNEIKVKSTSQFTIVTICKYECYQDENEDTNKRITNNQQTTNKQSTTNKNEKNNKENIYREFQHLFITEDEIKKLLEKNTITQIDNILNDIENYKGNTKYKSLYLTAVKWLQKNQPTSEGISPEEIKARKYGYIN
jgi:DNA-binding transcriptional MerR regulator